MAEREVHKGTTDVDVLPLWFPFPLELKPTKNVQSRFETYVKPDVRGDDRSYNEYPIRMRDDMLKKIGCQIKVGESRDPPHSQLEYKTGEILFTEDATQRVLHRLARADVSRVSPGTEPDEIWVQLKKDANTQIVFWVAEENRAKSLIRELAAFTVAWRQDY